MQCNSRPKSSWLPVRVVPRATSPVIRWITSLASSPPPPTSKVSHRLELCDWTFPSPLLSSRECVSFHSSTYSWTGVPSSPFTSENLSADTCPTPPGQWTTLLPTSPSQFLSRGEEQTWVDLTHCSPPVSVQCVSFSLHVWIPEASILAGKKEVIVAQQNLLC